MEIKRNPSNWVLIRDGTVIGTAETYDEIIEIRGDYEKPTIHKKPLLRADGIQNHGDQDVHPKR